MPEMPRSERKTQNRVIDLFTDPARPDNLGYRLAGPRLQNLGRMAIDKRNLSQGSRYRTPFPLTRWRVPIGT